MKQSEIVKEIEEFVKDKFKTMATIEIEPHILQYTDNPCIVMDYRVNINFMITNKNED